MKQLLIATLLVAGVVPTTTLFALTKADEIGEPGSPGMADRTLQVTANTRYLNVRSGETVNLDVNGQRVTWQFDGLAWQVNLQEIVPGAPNIDVYVAQPGDN